MANIQHEIYNHLASKSLLPNLQWLNEFMSSIRPTNPLPALQRTAEFRLLSSDITTSLATGPQMVFPAGISDCAVREQRIPGPVAVQVLDIEDVGRSRWSQLEAIEMEERGETRKGHEVIRVVADQDEAGNADLPGSSSGPHKLLLQDAKANKVFAFELERIKDVDLAMGIGRKLVLRDFVVSRGVVMLTARGTTVLNGKVDAWDKKWREERKKHLEEKVGRPEQR